MRHLVYTNYQSGHSGLSNGIMSIECGVALAFLTNRFLVLEGNVSPPANIVSYGGRVDNTSPSRVTDLIDLPVPWADATEVDLGDAPSRELTDEHLGQLVVYFPGTLDIESDDARAFARDRKVWVHPGGELDHVPVLKLTERPVVLREGSKRTNLNFYSYAFYLDNETRRSLYRVLERMRPKPELAALADRVARDLGSFNAVHLRRGDFKRTFGVTTLDRQPWEAIEAMDHHFRRDDNLVVLTDERDDPFFDEIKAAYPRHVFVDHHILDEYGEDFDRLPARDSLALAHLSQLVAAESRDFIGTMTSTFTALVQRYRGNRGREERFKFFWNELPEPDHRTERGRHPISECVPLDSSMMVEEFEGPYSWNRYNQRIAPSWMREWPESFLTEEVLATGRLAGREAAPELDLGHLDDVSEAAGARVVLPFGGLRIAVRHRSRRLGVRIAETFGVRREPRASQVIAELEVVAGRRLVLTREGHALREASDEAELLRELKLEMARIFCFARPHHLWVEGASFVRNDWALALAGDLGKGETGLVQALAAKRWDLMADDVVPIHASTHEVLPFGRTAWPRGTSVRARSEPAPLRALVLCALRLHHRDELSLLSPAVGVAESLAHSLDFREDRKRAVERLCKLAETVPIFLLSYSRVDKAAGLLAGIDEKIASQEARLREARENRNEIAAGRAEAESATNENASRGRTDGRHAPGGGEATGPSEQAQESTA